MNWGTHGGLVLVYSAPSSYPYHFFRLGKVLQGRLGKYTVTKEIQDTVWFVKGVYEIGRHSSMRRLVKGYGNPAGETVVVKSVQGHPRVENERDVLKRFQNQNPHSGPLIDQIKERALWSSYHRT